MRITRSLGTAVGIAAVTALGLAGCSSGDDTTPSEAPTPTETSASASPTATSASPTKSSASPTSSTSSTKDSIAAGGKVKVAGQGADTYKTTGGTMTFTPTSGALGGKIEVFAKGDAKTGDFDMQLTTNASGTVTSGSLTSPGTEYTVTGKAGKINFLTTGSGTTLVTVSAIPVQAGTASPTTMTINITGNKS